MKQLLDKKISANNLLKFAFPTIVSMIFLGIYTTIDGIFISQFVGTTALSAVNIVMPIITASIAIGTMLGTGGSAIIAKRMGEGKYEEARRNFSFILVSALFIGILITIIAFLFVTPITYFLGADEVLFPYCQEYIYPILMFTPALIFSIIFQTFFIAEGKANLGLLFSVLGGVINIVLDYVFIVLLGWGLKGAAIATGIGYFIPSIIGALFFAFNKKGNLFFVKPEFKMSVLIKSCTNGASEMITNLSMSVVTLLLNKILMKIGGADGVASITIILYAQALLSSAYMGYSIGIAPIISFNYGKKDREQLKRIYSISLKTITIASIITFAISIIFTNMLVEVFVKKDTAVYNMSIQGFQLFAMSFLFMGYNIFGSAMFTALSNGKISAILSVFRTLIFVVISALIMPAVMGLNGVWICIPFAEMLGLIMTIYYFKSNKKVYNYG